jgi:hypothetical protein
MNPIKVEVGQYREVNKGSLKAFFSLVIYPQGEKIIDCKYFENGEKKWFNFPQKEVKYPDGRKSEYIPYISYLNKEYLQQLQAAVLAAIKTMKPKEAYDGSKAQAGAQNPVSSQSSVGWDWGSV